MPTDLIVVRRTLARLSEGHPLIPKLTELDYQMSAGFSGELDVDRILHEIEFPHSTIILKDIALEVNPHYFTQIDTLVITPTRAIILEVKKYAGNISFDDNSGKTTIISTDGTITKINCILHQLDRAKEGLRQWLANRNILLPAEAVIVMANQRTVINEMPKLATVKYGKQLPLYIRNLPNFSHSLSINEIQSIASQIKQGQYNWKYKPACERYQIEPDQIKRGVLCLKCNGLMYRKQGRTWRCSVCGKYGTHELAQSLSDWFLLIKPTISNKECREFLDLKSKYAASVVLKESMLNRQGNPPGNHYEWDYKSQLFRNELHQKSRP